MQSINGPRQRVLLAKASWGLVIPYGNAEQCAARRLVRRGVLVAYRLGGPEIGYMTVYRVAS